MLLIGKKGRRPSKADGTKDTSKDNVNLAQAATLQSV